MSPLGTNYGAWIDRSGNITPVEVSGNHHEVARQQFGVDQVALMSQGFVHVGTDHNAIYGYVNEPTAVQLRVLRELGIEAGKYVEIDGKNYRKRVLYEPPVRESEISARADALINKLLA